MQLVLSNSQGELSPLEIGIHALKAVPKETGGRGKKGGLSAYAELIGQKQQNVTTYRQAAEVYGYVKPTHQYVGFHSKTLHLAAIHKAPQECWAALVNAYAPI